MFNPNMPYRSLGACGTKVSVLSLGGWTTFGGTIKDIDLIKKIHRQAYDAGINFFDNADIYAKGGSEKVVGEALRDFPRHELVISSKVFWPMSEDINDKGLSRKHIFESVDKSLRRMGTDYFDIYFCHRFDEQTPLLETCRAMDHLVRQGKVLYWGTSEWTGAQLREAHHLCREQGLIPPQIEQPQYSLLVRDRFELDTAMATQELGMGTVTWSPLASGVLTGKYDNGVSQGRLAQITWLQEGLITDENMVKMRKFKELSMEVEIGRTQLALAWALKHVAVSSVILGVTHPEQLAENLESLKVQITPQLDQQLTQIFS